ncbi:MAG TPA: hypothetical protein VID94_12270 [Acidimicrobiales bacterium]
MAVRSADPEDLGPNGPAESSEAGRETVGMAGGCHTEAPMRFLVPGAARLLGSPLAPHPVDGPAVWATA